MSKITRGWPPARRAKQAENMRKTRPWEHSTGPKTPEGKKVVAQNAIKHGFYGEDMREIRRILRLQRHFVRSILAGQSHENRGYSVE